MSNLIQPVKGTRDFYPEDWAFQMWFYEKVKEVSLSFGFEEYEGPIIESLELYAAKSGEELVKKQAFTFKDQSEKVVALRPEMTPTLARMIAQKSGELTFPVKWFTFGRRFRYEKPQKGRGREFFQWDADILGSESPEADAEAIALAANLYRKLDLTPQEVRIKVNDRALLQERLVSLGIPEEKVVAVFRLIDKKSKVSEKDFFEMAGKEGLNKDQITAINQIITEKDAHKDSPWLNKVFDLLKKQGCADFVEFDPSIVRGLEYYTRTVFEGWDIKGEFRSIWGGGRYDNLTAEIGSKQRIPGVGFAMGDRVIAEILRANNKFPSLNPNKTRVLVTVFSEKLYEKSLEIGQRLRTAGLNTEVFLEVNTKLDKQLKYADRKKIPYAVIVGPDEAKNETVTVKKLEDREQKTYTLEEFLETLSS